MAEPQLPPDFSVTVEETPRGGIVVRIVGEPDLQTVQEVEETTRTLRESGREVLFDLEDLTFIDSSGLRYFVGLHHEAQRDGFAFTMSRPRYRVMRAFELTALDTVLPWADRPSKPDD